MRKAALKFPKLVAETPMRTHAILAKYTALRSYHARFGGLKMPAFEMAGVYATILQEACLNYKTVAKNLQVLAFGVSPGQARLIAASGARRKSIEPLQAPASSKSSAGSAEATVTEKPATPESTVKTHRSLPPGDNDEDDNNKQQQQQLDMLGPYKWRPIVLTRDFPPTIKGLEDARGMVRTILIRIVQEINILSKLPEAAMDEAKVQPHISPFLFKEFLPVSFSIILC